MKRSLKLIIIIVLVLVAFVVMRLFGSKKVQPTKQQATAVRVVARYVCSQAMPLSVHASAKVLAQQQTILQPKVSGYITKILFKEGQLVHEGQALIVLDDRIQLADVQQKQIDLQQKHTTYQRNLAASNSGGISKEVLDKAWSDYKNAQNGLQQAKITLQNMIIHAPFQGVVGQNNLSVGEYVTPQTSLLHMVDQNHLRVTYTLPSKYLSSSKVGQKVTVTSSSQSYPATVSFVGSEIDPQTQTYSVTAMLGGKKSGLLPGLFVQIKQQLGVATNTLMLPGFSVQTQIGSYYVYAVKDNKAQQVEVSLGPRVGNSVAITSGLHPGQLVITQGADQLHPQSAIIVSQVENKECH